MPDGLPVRSRTLKNHPGAPRLSPVPERVLHDQGAASRVCVDPADWALQHVVSRLTLERTQRTLTAPFRSKNKRCRMKLTPALLSVAVAMAMQVAPSAQAASKDSRLGKVAFPTS